MEMKKIHAVVLRTLAAPVVNHVLSIKTTWRDSTVGLNLFPKEPECCLGRLRGEDGKPDWVVCSTELVPLLEKCVDDRCDLVTASRSWMFARTALPNMEDWASRAQKNMFFVLPSDSPWRKHVAGPDSRWKRLPECSISARHEIFTLKSAAGYGLAVAFVSSGDDGVTQALSWGRDFLLFQGQPGAVFVDGCASTALWTDQDVIHEQLSLFSLRGFEVFCKSVPFQEFSAVDDVIMQKNDRGVIEFCIRSAGSSGVVNFRLNDGFHFPFVLADVPLQVTLTSALSGGLMQVTRQGGRPSAENEWWFRFAMPQNNDKLSNLNVQMSGVPENKFLFVDGGACQVFSNNITHVRDDQEWTVYEFDKNGVCRSVGADRLKNCLGLS